MSRFYGKLSVVALVVLGFIFQANSSMAQCGCAATDFASISVSGWTVGQSANITTCQFAGERSTITGTVAGAVYRVSTCGAGYDTQLTIYTTGCSYLAYNDDNGPSCATLQASVNFTSPGGSIYSVMNEYNGGGCLTNSTCTTVSITLISVPAPQPVGCGIAPESSPTVIAATGCAVGSVNLGGGAYYDLPITAGTYYNFTWGNNGAPNINGFCATPLNGSGSFAFTSNQTCWFSGTTTSLRVSSNRSSPTWSTTSGQMQYRHTLPTATANTPDASTICAGNSVSIAGGSALCGVGPYWQGTNAAGTNPVAGPQSVSATGTYYYRPFNNGCWGTAQATAVTVVPTPTVSAGPVMASICQGGTSGQLGGSVGGGATGGTWSTASGGTFNPNANTVNATWTPPAGFSGTATLTLTTTGMEPCAPVAASKTIVVIATPTVSIGPAIANICQGGTTVGLGAGFGGGATGGTWSTPAGGSFSPNANTANATWTPPPGYSGTTSLTFSTTGMAPCSAASDSKAVTVIATPTVSIGPAIPNICQGGTTAALGGGIGGGATGAAWSTSSSGFFTPNANTLNATWTPPVGFSGTATLTLTTTGMAPCSAAFDSKTVTVIGTPTAGAIAAAQTVCVGGAPASFTSATDGTGSGVSYRWESSTTSAFAGFGPIAGPAGSTYTAGALTQTTWFRRITISTVGGVSCESVATTPVEITVVPDPIAPTITKSPNVAEVCAGTVLTINVFGGSDGTGTCANEYRFSNDNGGSWSGWSTTIPSVTSIAGTTIIEAKRECNGSGCNSSVSSVSWIVNPVPVVVATPTSQSFCSGETTNITLSTLPVVAGTTFAWTVTGGAGTSGFSAGSGSSIAQQLFNTSGIPAVVTYTITPTALTCVGSFITVQVTVNPIPNVVANPTSLAICNGGLATINLTSAVTAAAFNWTVSGTPGTGGFSSGTGSTISQILTNSTLAPGTVTYTITPSGNGCTGSFITVPVTVNNTPAVTFSSLGGPYCISQTTPISLVAFASPTGGVFSGTGVAGNDFVPSLAAVGTNTLTYTYSDGNTCVGSAQQTVVVTGLPLVSFSGLSSSYCIDNSAAVPLTGFPTGGTFTGPGVVGSNFTPSSAGIGLHNVVYTYTDVNGCVNSQTQSVNVFPLPIVGIFDLAPSYCISDAPVTISGFPPGGTFSGPGISGTTFSPVAATVGGPYTITYNFTDINSCSNSSTATTIVYPLPVVSFTGLAADYCVDAASVTLVGSPAGGTFSGVGVTNGGVFTPQTAGVGTHSVTYTYTNANGCTDFQTQNVVVNVLPNVSFSGLNPEYCIDDAAITLTGNQAPNGTFSGTGITDNGNGTATFNPATATIGGPYNILYSFTNGNGCGGSQTQQVVVNPLPVVSYIGLAAAYCVDAAPVTLTGVYAPSGTFSGSGITDNADGTATFNPSVAGAGLVNITYTYTDNNSCSSFNTQSTTVNPLPVVSYTGSGTFCVDQPAQNMVGTPVGGTFSGIGVSGNQFLPTVAGVGSFPVTYTYTDANSCVNSATETFIIHNIPQITSSPQSVQVCPGDAAVFSASATGTSISYQWQVNAGSGFTNLTNGGIYSGVTTTTLSVSSIAQGLNGYQYRAVVTGATCSTQVPTSAATITISSSPTIATQPADQFVCVGDNGVFSVSALGSNLTYQWQINTGSGFVNVTNGGAYSGATTANLTVSNFSIGMDGDLFQVIVSGSVNCTSSATSSVVSINGSNGPAIVSNPANNSICENDIATFTAAASGSGLVYQWQVNNGGGFVNLADGGIYAGTSTATLTINGATLAENGFTYQVIISSASCPNTSVSVPAILTITTSPGITLQPVDVQVCPSDNATFTVTADGSGNTYQWQQNAGSGFVNLVNSGAYSGATSSTLSISSVTAAMDGYQYRVVVDNSLCAGSSTSLIATLSESTAPIIAQQPSDEYFCQGDNVAFTVVATGTSLGYQWQVNTGNGFVNVTDNATYSGSTSSTLSVTNATTILDGNLYRVVVNGSVNCAFTSTSVAVQLIETTTPVVLTQPASAAICEGSDVSFAVSAGGNLTYQWQVNSGGGFVNVANGGVYSGATSPTLTVSGVTVALDGNQYQVVLTGANCLGNATSSAATLTITNSPSITAQPADQYACGGDDATFSVSVSGSGMTYQWQEDNGSGFVNVSNGGAYSGATSANLTVAGVTSVVNGYQYQVVISSVNCLNSSTSAIATLFESTSPIVLTNPSDAQICPGDLATFSVSAGGNGLGYQWQVNSGSGFTNLNDNAMYSGSTTGTLTVSGATASMNNYQYRAVVSGSINCALDATSTYAVLTISAYPTIVTQPLGQNYCVGDVATFTVAANGAQSYQWQENDGSGWSNLSDGGIYSGATTATLTLTGITAANDGYQYQVIVSGSSNCQGAITSDVVTLTEDPNPFIATQPVNAYACPGDGASFNVVATGSGLVYQWQENNGSGFVNISNGGVYSGANTSTLAISDATGLDAYQYICTITGAVCTGSSTTAVVTITETTQPFVLTQPVDQYACPNDNVTFGVSVGGSGLTYQWQVNDGSGFVDVTDNTTYSGATTANLTVNGVVPGLDGNVYHVIVTGANCPNSSTSTDASLFINTAPVIVTQPVAAAICSGANTSFSVAASGPNLTYQWQVNEGNGFVPIFNNSVYSGATTTVLNVTAASFGMDGNVYQVVVTGSINCAQTATTIPVVLSVTEQPVANAGLGGSSCDFDFTFSAVPTVGVGTWTQVSGPGTSTYSNVNSATATATATLEGQYVYQWEEVNGICSDASTVTVDVFNQPVANAGNGGNECDLNFTLNAIPSFGTGTWTQLTGPGLTTFAPNANSAGAVATVSAYGTYSYRWTEVNGTCSDFDEITVNYYDQPIANAGLGGDECDLDFVFNATLSTGTGVWTQTTGPGTSVFLDASYFATTATASQYGAYTYTWTETNGTCSDNAVVTVNYYEQPVAEAGNGGSECDLTFSLSATPSTGTGVWTATGPGTATYGSASSAATTATVSQVGVYTFTWTETNGVCTSSDNAVVTFYNQTVAEAGTGGDACDLDFVLSAVPTFGTGTWTQTAGPGFSNFVPNANDPAATAQVSVYGTYQFTWTEVNGVCTSSDAVTVNYYEQPIANAGPTADECDLNHTMAAVPSSGVGTWTQISGSGTSSYSDVNSATSTVTVSQYGTYVYQWEEIEGSCSDNATVTINYYDQPVANAGFGGFECDLDYQLTATPSVGTGTWTSTGPGAATFSPNANNPNALVTVAALGAYTFTWTEQNGSCIDSDAVIVTFEQQTTANAGQGGDECDLTFTFSAQPSFGTGVWTSTGPGTASYTDATSATSSVTVSLYGTYDFTWTETNGTCVTSDQVTVNFYEQPVANAGQGGNECDLDFVFNGTASVGVGTWTQISGSGISTFTDENSPTSSVTVSQYDTYVYQWEEVEGTCSDNATVTVNYYNQPVADAGNGGDACDLDFNLASIPSLGSGIWAQTSGLGTSSFISATSSATTVTVSQYGTYTFAWTEVNATCSDFDEVTVNFYDQPVADAGQGGDECDLNFVFNATLSTGSGIWTQTSGTGTTVFLDANYPGTTATASQYGTYVYTWTETNGSCTDAASVTVNYWNQPVADAGVGGDECDLNFNLAAIPSLGSGEWTQSFGSGTASFVSTTSANTTVTVNQYGTYTFTWTETNGVCVDSDVITVNFYEQPVADAGQGGTECDLNFVLSGTASVGTGTWTQTLGAGFSNFTPNANTANATVTVSQYGSYSFTWTEENGSCNDSETIAVDFFEQPVANAGTVSDQCDLDITFNGVASVGVGIWNYTGPGTAVFTPDDNTATATVTVSTYGIYDFTWTEINGGCTDADAVTVTFNPLPVVSFTGLAASYCVDQTTPVQLTGTPSGGTFSGVGISGNLFIPSIAGVSTQDITYTYTDPNGCTNSETQSVDVNAIPVVSFSGLSAEYCEDETTPSALVGTPSGGTFSGAGISGNDFEANAAGVGMHIITYSFTDPLGCTGTTTQTVVVNPLPVVSFIGLNSAYCEDIVVVTLTGSPAGGTFSGSGITGNTFSPSDAGTGTHDITYSYTDANGCSNSSTQSVVVNALPLPVILPAGPIALCEGSSITLDAGAGYGQYAWNTNQNGQSILVTDAGSYNVTVTSLEGCSSISDDVIVTVNPLPVVDLGDDITICTGGFVTLDAGNAGSSFVWSTLEVTQQIVVGTVGSYEVTVTDANGCFASDVVSVSVSNVLDPVITADGPTSFCADQTLTLNGGNGYASYLWTGGQQSQFIDVTTGGTFELTVTDQFGCVGTASIFTTIYQLPNAVIIPNGSTNLCPGASVVLTSSNEFTSYDWSPGGASTESITVSAPGTYTLTVVDPINGCSATSAPMVVTQSQGAVPTIVANGPLEFCVGDDVVLSVEPVGAFTSYLWTTGSGTPTITVTASATIGVQVLDANNCLTNTLVTNPVTVTVWDPNPIVEQIGETLVVTNGPFDSYQWFRNGVPLPGAILNNYTPELSGNFTVQVTDGNGCADNSDNVEFTFGVGIAEGSSPYNLNIYPNPNNGQFTVEADLGTNTDVTLIVKDVLGRQLMQPERIEGASSFRRTFDIGHLSNGIYFVQIIGAEGFTVEQLVKN